MPHPDSPPPAVHQSPWKFVASARSASVPNVQVGNEPKTNRVIAFDCVTPLTV